MIKKLLNNKVPFWIRCFIIIFGVFFAFQINAADRHVAINGNDSNPGTLSQPWKTVRHAGATAVAGDVVYIHEGIYNDMLMVRNSGTEANPIIFTSYNGENAIIDGTGKELYSEMDWVNLGRRWHGVIDMYNVSWIIIRGLKVQNATLGNGIYGQKAHNITIEGNKIDNTFNSGIGFYLDGVQPNATASDQKEPQDTNIWILSTNITIRNNEVSHSNNGGWSEVISLEGVNGFEISGNYVHDNYPGVPGNFWGGGGENIDMKRSTRNGNVFNNVIHTSRRLGIYVEAWDGYCQNINIYNNLVYDLELGAGIVLASEHNGVVSGVNVYNNIIHHTLDGIIIPDPNKKPIQTVRNVNIYNNTVVETGEHPTYPSGYGFKMDNEQAKNIRVYNNIFKDNRTEQINVAGQVPAAEYVIERNLIHIYKGASANSRKGTNPIELDPLFKDQATYNYYLQAASPAINAANTALVAGSDYINSTRPYGGGYDLGAFEYIGEVDPPAAPSGLTAVAFSSSQINLSWNDNSANENNFDIYRSVGDNLSFIFHKSLPANATAYSDVNLDAGTTYYYRVLAKNIGGPSGYSNQANATTEKSGGAGTFTQSSGVDGLVCMEAENFSENKVGTGTFAGDTWDAFSDPSASGNTYMMVPNAGNPNGGTLTTTPSINFDINFNRAGTHYIWLRVATPSADDNSVTLFYQGSLVGEWHIPEGTFKWLRYSSQITSAIGNGRFSIHLREDGVKVDKVLLTSNYNYTPVDNEPYESPKEKGSTTAPIAPSGLTATANDWDRITINWSNNADNEAGHRIERRLGTGDFELVNLIGANYSSYTDRGLSGNTSYTYRVQAFNETGSSTFSNLATATTSAEPPSIPDSPYGLSAVSISTSSAELTWFDASDNEDGFSIEQRSGTGSFAQVATIGANTKSHIVSGLATGATYTFRVRAYNSLGNSEYTNEDQALIDGSGALAFEQSAASQGIVSVEAENFTDMVSVNGYLWAFTDTVAGYSGSGLMKAIPDNEQTFNVSYATSSPRLDFKINFVKTGTHYIWLRTYRSSFTDDSFHAGIDGNTPASADRIASNGATNTWTWGKNDIDANIVSINVPTAGIHTFNLWMREDGVKVDKIVLTTDPDYTPTGTGPVESTKGTGGGNIAPVANAGADQTLTDSDRNGSETITLDGTGSSDSDGTIVSYTWTEGSTTLGTGATLNYTFSIGIHTLTLAVTDNNGATATDQIIITVNEPAPLPFLQDGGSDGIISIEAENFDNKVSQGGHDWVEATATSGYSGVAYMLSTPDNGANVNTGYISTSPRLDYKINFVKTGTHYLWMRTHKGTAATDDSFHAGLDGIALSTSDRIQAANPSGEWVWGNGDIDANVVTINVTTVGEHTLNIWMREDGSKLDKLVITTSATYTPTGAGPDESIRGVEIPNENPVANAGVDQTVTDSDGNGTENVTLNGTSSSDNDGTIVSFIWTEGGTTLGTGASLNYSFGIGSHTVTLTVEDNDGATATDVVVITVNPQPAPSVTVAVKVNSSPNDARETKSTGTMYLKSTDLDMRPAYLVGIRVRLDVPKDAIIESASLKLVSKGTWSGSNTLTIKAQASDDAPIFTSTPYDISNRTTGREVVNWTPGSWVDGSTYTSDDLKSIIQQIVDRGGWLQNNFIVLTIDASTTNKRLARSFDYNGNNSQSPELIVTYRTGTLPPVNIAPTANAGIDQTVTDSDNTGSELVTMNASGSVDSDGTIVSYNWTIDGTSIATGVNPTINLATGTHILMLTVTDDDGATATYEVVVTVEAYIPPPSNNFTQDAGSNGLVVMEAEHFTNKSAGTGSFASSDWIETTDAAASNGLYMVTPNNGLNGGTSNSAPRLDYTINFVKSGTHYIWIRHISPSGNDNSLRPTFDGTTVFEWHTSAGTSWNWLEASSTFTASPGEHTFSIYMREDGLQLDKIILTTNPSLNPTGNGPGETKLAQAETPERRLHEVSAPTQVRLYPNPASQFVTFDLGFDTETEISVYNQVGMLVNKEKSFACQHTMNISGLQKGVYFISIRNTNHSSVHSLIVK